jgi:hypothetical protein
MSVRKKSSIPVWNYSGTPKFEKNAYSHGYRHIHYQMSPFSHDIDDQLLESIAGYSDNFTKKHSGKHILFAGCSVTQPAEIERKLGWAQQTYQKIARKEKVSGFYNIAVGGGSIALEISLIFKYIAKYGKPNVIFFNMPPSTRTLSNQNSSYDVKDDKLIRSGEIINSTVNLTHEYRYPGSMLMAEFFNFELYRALHQYCKDSEVQLISFSWSDQPSGFDPGVTQTLFADKFDTFYPAMNDNFISFTDEYISNPKNKSHTLLIAMDNVHPGNAEHAYYADFAFKIYEGINK